MYQSIAHQNITAQRTKIRRSITALLCLPLSGCFAFYIPGSVIDAAVGNPHYCTEPGKQVGERFAIGSQMYEITRVAGDSQYVCRNMPEGLRWGVDAKPV